MRTTPTILALILFLAPGLVENASAQEATPTLAAIRSEVERQLLTLEHVRLEFLLTHIEAAEPPVAQPWTWLKNGRVESIVMRPTVVGTDDDGNERWLADSVYRDGDEITRLDFVGRDLASVRISSDVATFDRNITPAHFIGARLFECEYDLVSVLGRPEAKVVESSNVYDDPCVSVVVPNVPMRNGGVGDWQFDLSVARSYLPRRMLLARRKAGEPVRKPEWTFTVKKFAQVEDPHFGTSRYFPTVMSNIWQRDGDKPLLLGNELEVASITLGVAVPPAEIAPDLPTGTQVTEVIEGQPSKLSYVGGEGRDIHRERIVSKARSLSGKPLADAGPARSNFTTSMFYGLAIFSATVACFVFIRSRR